MNKITLGKPTHERLVVLRRSAWDNGPSPDWEGVCPKCDLLYSPDDSPEDVKWIGVADDLVEGFAATIQREGQDDKGRVYACKNGHHWLVLSDVVAKTLIEGGFRTQTQYDEKVWVLSECPSPETCPY